MSYDSDVVSATSGRGEPDWDKIIKLCNRIRDSVGTLSMAQAMGSVMRRVKHTDANIQLHALTLLESCVSNCGHDFQMELTKPTFHTDVKAILTGPYTDPRVKQRVKDLLSSWVTEFKANSKMSPLIKFVEQLRVLPQSSVTTNSRPTQQAQTAPTVPGDDVDLKKAIELSLRESKNTPQPSSVSLYPSFGSTPAPPAQQKQPQKKVKKVRAVYDFLAAEDNELSFRGGEIITLLDDSDENWWRGETQLGRGLFPASFVSANLSVEPQPSSIERNEASQSSSGQKAKKTKKVNSDKKAVVINEEKIDLFLEMIKGADVTSEDNKAENETLMELEGECKKMKPLVDESITALQSQEDEMLEINKTFDDALSLYRKMLSEGPRLSTAMVQEQPVVAPPQQELTQYGGPSHPHNTLPPQQVVSYTLPQPHSLQGVSYTPPQPHSSQGVSYTPPQPHSLQGVSYTPPQPQSSQGVSYTPPQPHSLQGVSYTPPQPRSSPAVGYTHQQPLPSQDVRYATSVPQPPPYTADGVSANMYSSQKTGYEPPQLQQPSMSYGGIMVGQSTLPPVATNIRQPTFQPPQNYYSQPQSQPPVGLPSQMRSGMSPSPGAPSQPTSYQPSFYPQQQPLL